MTTTSESTTARARRSSRRVQLLVPVPGTSPIHELWAGTKLLVVFGFSVLLWFYPGWLTIALGWVLVLAAARIARIPRGVLPPRPGRVWILFGLAFVFSALSGGSPVLSVGGIAIGFGGALHFLRAISVVFLLFGLAAMVSWTTNVAEIAPAMTTLARPFALLKIPVDEWVVALSLGLRAFPMLIEEFQVLYAAYRLRPKPMQPSRRARSRQQAGDVIDLISAAIAMTLRRADEMGDAIAARGGTGQLAAAPARPKLADWVALAIAAAAGATAVAGETIFHLT